MTHAADVSFRSARREDAETLFIITKASIGGLTGASYSPNQVENWMGERTAAFYEELIATGRMMNCLRGGAVVSFVDALPGEAQARGFHSLKPPKSHTPAIDHYQFSRASQIRLPPARAALLD